MNDSNQNIVEQASEEGFPVEASFLSGEPSSESGYIDNQGKPRIHLNPSLMFFYKPLYHFCLYITLGDRS